MTDNDPTISTGRAVRVPMQHREGCLAVLRQPGIVEGKPDYVALLLPGDGRSEALTLEDAKGLHNALGLLLEDEPRTLGRWPEWPTGIRSEVMASASTTQGVAGSTSRPTDE